MPNLGGMRVLMEEDVFGLIGAFVVASGPLIGAWMFLETLIGLPGWLAIALAIALTLGLFEAVSRRLGGERPGPRPVPERRDASIAAGVGITQT